MCHGELWGAMGCCGCSVPQMRGAMGTPKGADGSPCAAAWPFPCEVEAGVFEVPAGYTVLGAGRSEPLRDEDDDLLQFAIQQSLLDAGTETDQVRLRPLPWTRPTRTWARPSRVAVPHR